MTIKDLQNYSHKRYNILTGEWILVSPHRAKRPWQGQNEEVQPETRPSYDKHCYLCPGNTRANGEKNPKYNDVYVFNNDFAALQQGTKSFDVNDSLFNAKSESGICRVVCFSSDHSKSLAQMSVDTIHKVVKVWKQEYKQMSQHEDISYVQIFENKGAMMGCSNPHPHGQIWSQSSLPNEIVKKNETQYQYYKENKSSLLGDYLQQELNYRERIIYENDSYVILVPFWATWPYETMIIPKKHQKSVLDMSVAEERLFADAISSITSAYDKLFQCSFPYSAGIHQSPVDGREYNHWHWHKSFYPPLLRSATVKKFMVGYEMFGSPQRDITAEQSAKKLSELI